MGDGSGGAPEWAAARDRGVAGDSGGAVVWDRQMVTRCGEAERHEAESGIFFIYQRGGRSRVDAASDGMDIRI